MIIENWCERFERERVLVLVRCTIVLPGRVTLANRGVLYGIVRFVASWKNRQEIIACQDDGNCTVARLRSPEPAWISREPCRTSGGCGTFSLRRMFNLGKPNTAGYRIVHVWGAIVTLLLIGCSDVRTVRVLNPVMVDECCRDVATIRRVVSSMGSERGMEA